MENPFELILEKLTNIENLLKASRKTETVIIPAVNEIFNISQAADYLGLAKSTLYKMTSCRLIPHAKTGKRIYLKRIELDEWITKHKIKTREEIELEADEYLSKKRRYKL